jgi:hypothetical protein
MTLTMAIDAGWAGILGVAVGALASLATAILARRWQRNDRREERSDRQSESRATLRRDAYARFLAAAEARRSTADPDPTPGGTEGVAELASPPRGAVVAFEKAVHEFDAAVQQVRLLGGPAVVGALEKFLVWWESFDGPISVSAWDDAERPLIDAMRAEQDADRPAGS